HRLPRLPPAAPLSRSRRAPVRFLARSAKTESDRKVGHYKNKGLSIGMGRPERGRDSRKLVVGRDGAGMLGIGVLGLHAIEMFVDFEGWFEEAVGTDKEALVADLAADQREVPAIPPGVAIGVGDGFGELVAQGVVGRINELPVGRALGRVFAAGAGALPGFHGEDDVAEVGEGDAGVISAEEERGGHAWRIADLVGRRIEAGVHARREKQMIDVTVAVEAGLRDDAVQDGDQVGLEERIFRDGIGEDGAAAYEVTVARGDSGVLIEKVDEIALAYVFEKGFRVAPAPGDGARTARVDEDGVGSGEQNRGAALEGHVARILCEVVAGVTYERFRGGDGGGVGERGGGMVAGGECGGSAREVGMLVDVDGVERGGAVGFVDARVEVVAAERGSAGLGGGSRGVAAESEQGYW